MDSQGDVRWFSTAEGRDRHDAIEHIATLPWCSGKVALIGNSWLAAAQWFIAAEQPPCLTCIAPLEGLSDLYREVICRAGVPFKTFLGFLGQSGLFGEICCKDLEIFGELKLMAMISYKGRNKQEDVAGMIEKYPLMNGY
jgi:uncharacterized protein